MPTDAQQPAPPTGAAIVMPVPADVAERIALDGGLPASDLHVTLAYLPEFPRGDDEAFEQLRTVVAAWALGTKAFDAKLSGLGRFTLPDADALYLSVDAPALAAARQVLVEALTAAGLTPSSAHGFSPHITLRYLAASDPLPLERADTSPLVFTTASIWQGEQHDDVPLGAPSPSAALSAKPSGYGPAVELSIPPTDAEGGPWCTLAYAVELKGYKLKGGGHAKITAQDIDDMVRNFGKYPKAPLVVEHADTRPDVAAVNPAWAEPCGHVVALRRGSLSRLIGDAPVVVPSLEGRLDAPPDVRLAINGDPANGVPPKWPFCSITPAQGHDDEHDKPLGTVLWSVSLTAHPRLADLPRLAAGKDLTMPTRPFGAPPPAPQPSTPVAAAEHGYYYGSIDSREDLVEMLRCVFELPALAPEADILATLERLEKLSADAVAAESEGVDTGALVGSLRSSLRLPALSTAAEVLSAVRQGLATMPAEKTPEMSRGPAAQPTPKEGKSMKTFLELAAEMNIPAANEDAARERVLALAADGAAVRKTLNLGADAQLAPRLSDLVTAQASLPKVEAELAQLKAAEKERTDAGAKAEAERAEADLVRRVDEVCLSKGWPDDVKPALLSHGRSNREDFDVKYPAPSTAELAQRQQDAARTGRIEFNKTGDPPPASPAAKGGAGLAADVARIKAIALEAGEQVTELEAFAIAGRMTPDEFARQIGAGATAA